MDGVILFVDDAIFDQTKYENKLFNKLNDELEFPILPINTLDVFEKTINSISTIKAILLDWNFKVDNQGTGGAEIPNKTPLDILLSSEIFSFIFIFSEDELGSDAKGELEMKYKNKIQFLTKGTERNEEKDKDLLKTTIEDFEKKNKHLHTPFLWCKAINKSVQTIFKELENADPNWIKEIYNTAKEDHAEPNGEVINVFQNLLNESVIQDNHLITSLADSSQIDDVEVDNKEQSLAKLYNRIYYTKLLDTAPIMTGDIFKFSEDEFAVLITPECDVFLKKEVALEFLRFNIGDFDKFLLKKEYKKEKFKDTREKQLKPIRNEFNNGNLGYHLLPSFPFVNGEYNISASISFANSFVVKTKVEFVGKRTEYKLNSPYIYQLRQRYLAYIGRVGVPSIPTRLKEYNLK